MIIPLRVVEGGVCMYVYGLIKGQEEREESRDPDKKQNGLNSTKQEINGCVRL
jgi:hypothetical protein